MSLNENKKLSVNIFYITFQVNSLLNPLSKQFLLKSQTIFQIYLGKSLVCLLLVIMTQCQMFYNYFDKKPKLTIYSQDIYIAKKALLQIIKLRNFSFKILIQLKDTIRFLWMRKMIYNYVNHFKLSSNNHWVLNFLYLIVKLLKWKSKSPLIFFRLYSELNLN